MLIVVWTQRGSWKTTGEKQRARKEKGEKKSKRRERKSKEREREEEKEETEWLWARKDGGACAYSFFIFSSWKKSHFKLFNFWFLTLVSD